MPDLEAFFRGLADKTRLRIVNLLLTGELCVCDIQRLLEASQSGVSRHLNYLKHAGLLHDRRDGVRIFYRLATEQNSTLRSLCEWLRVAFQKDEALQADLARLKQALKEGSCSAPPGEISVGQPSQASADSTIRG